MSAPVHRCTGAHPGSSFSLQHTLPPVRIAARFSYLPGTLSPFTDAPGIRGICLWMRNRGGRGKDQVTCGGDFPRSDNKGRLMEALISSTVAVTIAEIGDKSQLLSLFLASRFSRPYAIIAGICAATLFNHTVSALLGAWLLGVIPAPLAPWIISISFLLIALWLLIPDKQEESPARFDKYGAFIATTVLFFLVEIGDKTQIATVVLAARYSQTFLVIVGTTLGMVLANLPVVLAGGWIMRILPLKLARWGAFALFLSMAVISAIAALSGNSPAAG